MSKHVRHEDWALTICQVGMEVLDKLGDPVTRDGVVAHRDVKGTLLHALRRHKWEGSIHIRNCPFHFLDIQTGKGEFLRQAHSKGTFRYLGVFMNTALDWEAHKIKLAKSLHELTRQLKTAKHSRRWGLGVLSLVTSGKVVGLCRFHFRAVPIERELVRKWDAPIANTLSSSYRLGFGVSPWQLYRPSPMGVALPSLLSAQCATLVQQVYSALHSEREEGLQTRISLYEYRAAKRMKACLLSVPWHPLEPRPLLRRSVSIGTSSDKR